MLRDRLLPLLAALAAAITFAVLAPAASRAADLGPAAQVSELPSADYPVDDPQQDPPTFDDPTQQEPKVDDPAPAPAPVTPVVPQSQPGPPAADGTATDPRLRARLLAVGTRLGGRKKNLLTVKFTAPVGLGVDLLLVIPAKPGGRGTLLAHVVLTPAQSKLGSCRLKLNAAARRRVKATGGKGLKIQLTPLDAAGKPVS